MPGMLKRYVEDFQSFVLLLLSDMKGRKINKSVKYHADEERSTTMTEPDRDFWNVPNCMWLLSIQRIRTGQEITDLEMTFQQRLKEEIH